MDIKSPFLNKILFYYRITSAKCVIVHIVYQNKCYIVEIFFSNSHCIQKRRFCYEFQEFQTVNLNYQKSKMRCVFIFLLSLLSKQSITSTRKNLPVLFIAPKQFLVPNYWIQQALCFVNKGKIFSKENETCSFFIFICCIRMH